MAGIERKVIAWLLTGGSAVLFVRNMLQMDGPTNEPLGMITMLGFGGGCFWLWEIGKQEMRERARFHEKLRRRDARE